MIDLERQVQIQHQLRELLLRFSRRTAVSLSLPGALEGLAPEIQAMSGGTAVEIWLHERRSKRLTLAAATGHRPARAPVMNEDVSHPAAYGLRLEEPEFLGHRLVAPLRGWRRALGTLIIEDPGTAPGSKGRGGRRATRPDPRELLEFARELARQLSVGVENVQLLDEILRQHRLLEDTFNSLVDLVAVMDRDLRIVQTNGAFAARIGMKREEVMRRPLSDLVGAETLAYVEAADTWQGVVPAAQRRVDDPELDGTFLLTATPLVNEDGQTTGRVLVARDITRQTRLEAERAALRERLGQAERLASLGQFVAGIAHEMNNPLQGVLGHLELLIDMSDAARPVRRELKLIFQEADRAAKIVHNLLVFTGTRRMPRKKIQIDRLLTRVIASRAPNRRKAGIRLVRRQGARLPPVVSDGGKLQQALLNVLINAEHALAATAGEREIDISTTVRRSNNVVRVTIRDNGPGIPDDVLPRIFDPFFTTKEVGQGTGLGLAITYGIVQEHGGTITAGNARDGGAVFVIDLPAAEVGGKVTRSRLND